MLHGDLQNTWLVTSHTVTSVATFSLTTKYTSVGSVTKVSQVTKFTRLIVVNVVDAVTMVTMATKLLFFLCYYSYVNTPDMFRSADISRLDCPPHSSLVLNCSELRAMLAIHCYAIVC